MKDNYYVNLLRFKDSKVEKFTKIERSSNHWLKMSVIKTGAFKFCRCLFADNQGSHEKP